MVSAATATWQPLSSSSFYRSTRAYSLDGTALAGLSLADYVVASAPSGGPLALMRDPSKPVLVTDQSTYSRDKGARVRVFSCAGALLQTVVRTQWDSPAPVVSLLYPSLSSSPDTLCLVTRSGLLRLYALSTHPTLPHHYTQHSIPGAEEAGGVVDAKSAGEGAIVVRFANGAFVEVRGLGKGAQPGDPVDEGNSFPAFATSSKKKREPGAAVVKTVPLAATGLTPEEARGSCWAVLPGEVSSTRGTEVLVGTADGRVLRVDEIDCQEQRLPTPTPVLSLSPSPNGRFLSVLSGSSSPHPPFHTAPYTLQVLTSDLSRSLSSCSLSEAAGEDARPAMVEWCGSNAVAVAWNDERSGTGTVVVVGPFGETLKYFYPAAVHLTAEVDCVRVVCAEEACELVEMVPAPTQTTLLPGSLTPSALLYSASQAFHVQKSPRADEFIRSIGKGPELVKAVEECLEAAKREWVGGEAKGLLQAAAFGRSFLDSGSYNPSDFVATTKTLRVLNAVRDWKIGIAVGWEQYHLHPPSHLIVRLLQRQEHLLALRLSSFLGLPVAPVVRHWALQLIAESAPGQTLSSGGRDGGVPMTDEGVCAAIVGKLKSLSAPSPSSTPLAQPPAPTPTAEKAAMGLTPADLALPAYLLGRPNLARLLLDKEPRRARQVPLLVRMGEGEAALRVAVEGGDLDLVFTVFLSLRRTLPPGDLFRLIERVDASLFAPPPAPHPSSKLSRAAPAPPPSIANPYAPPPKRPQVAKLFELFCRQLAQGGQVEEMRLVKELWYQDDWRVELGIEGIRESLAEPDLPARRTKLKQAQKAFAEDKESGFEAKMLDDQLRLLAFQSALESENPGKAFVGLSVNGTMRACILAGLDKKAEKLRSEFKVPDKRYWYLHLRALIALRAWDALAQFARKRSPIGYEPFVQELIKAGAHREAVKYVEKCDGRNRVELYVRCGEWEMAGRECVRRAERGKLMELKSRAPNNIIHAQLDELLQEMQNAGM
ncbi:hypothetical protein JCM10213_006070 [Rhodosporidiobolus nylandii]